MHRYKLVPSILLILSLINVVFAAPVVSLSPEPELLRRDDRACVDMADVPEDVMIVSDSEKRSDGLEKRWDTYSNEPWQKRGSSQGSNPEQSVEESPANQGPVQNTPPSPASPGESYSSDHGDMSSEGYHASDESGPGPSSSTTDIIGKGTNPGGSPGSSKSYPPWNRPQLASDMSGHWSTKSQPLSDGPESYIVSSKEVMPESSTVKYPSESSGGISTAPDVEPFAWNPHDWSTTSSERPPPPPTKKKKFMNKTKNFFNKLVYKFKFWPRGPEVF